MSSITWNSLYNNVTVGLLNAYLKHLFPSSKVVNYYSADTPFYKNTVLVKVELLNKENVVHWYYTLCKDSMYLRALDLTNGPIYQFNDEYGIVINHETVIPYIDFFFSHVKGRHGFFNILHSIEDIPLDKEISTHFVLNDQEVESKNIPEDKTEGLIFHSLTEALNFYVKDLEILDSDPQSGFRVGASILFKNSLFGSEIWVQPNGIISLENEQLKIEGLPLLPVEVHNVKNADFDKVSIGEKIKQKLADTFIDGLTDEKILFCIYEVLFKEALLQAEGHILLRRLPGQNETDELIRKFSQMVEKNRPVVVLESSQPFIEEIVAKLISKEDCLKLTTLPVDFKQNLNSNSSKLIVPVMGNNTLLLLPMHTFLGLEQEERFVFDVTTNESAIFIGCYSFSSLPESLQRIADLVIKIPEINYGNFRHIFEKLYNQPIPQEFIENSFSWVGQVIPNDFQQPHKLQLNPEETIQYIKYRVDERNKKVSPDNSPKLKELFGLGEAKAVVSDIIADIDSAICGKVSWTQVDKGMLIVGPPGTGKTTLARAIAKECGIKFVNASATKWASSEHLGYHIQAIHADFATARRFAPSILFIDELDSIGSRENDNDKNSYYQTQVINALLQEIQGFTPNDKVIIIGATNYEDKIDPALRRAGRLDQVVHVPYPNIEALNHIFQYYLQPYKLSNQLSEDINTSELAELCFGLTGADVEQFVRGASRRARKATRNIQQKDLLAEILGKSRSTENSRRLSRDEMYRLAVHESGHALLKILSKSKGEDIAFVSIVPQYDGSLGFVASLPSESTMLTLQDYTQMLEVFLAGRAAEEVCFGADQVSSGAGGSANSDLAKATHLLSRMIAHMGLGKSGGLLWMETAGSEQQEEIRRELFRIYGQVLNKLYRQKPMLDQIAGILVEKQEIRGMDLLKLLTIDETHA